MIAIKYIKMPVNCEECFARLLSWCRLDEEERMVIPALPDESFEGRPDWCPMVEIPDEAGNCSEIPNKSDSVSRQTAVEAIANQSRYSAEEIINICDKSVQDENGWLGGLKEAILAVLELPSAQPERKKGKWVYSSPVTMKCDQCGCVIRDWDWHRFKFCPVCDADMRGDQDDTD